MAETFRSKVVEIQATHWDGSQAKAGEIIEWVFDHGGHAQYREVNETVHHKNPEIIIHTLEGDMIAAPGWWIIKGTKGEFYPCRGDVFEEKYELVS